MKREDIVRELEKMLDALGPVCCYNTDEFTALEWAIEKTKGSQPNPITGLVNCGCGGNLIVSNDTDDGSWYVECDSSGCSLTIGMHHFGDNCVGEFYTKEEAIKAANSAMGYHEEG